MAGETAGATALPGKADRRGQPSLGALGGTRTPTMLLTATSRQRVYQFRHERLDVGREVAASGADVTNRQWGYKAGIPGFNDLQGHTLSVCRRSSATSA